MKTFRGSKYVMLLIFMLFPIIFQTETSLNLKTNR